MVVVGPPIPPDPDPGKEVPIEGIFTPEEEIGIAYAEHKLLHLTENDPIIRITADQFGVSAKHLLRVVKYLAGGKTRKIRDFFSTTYCVTREGFDTAKFRAAIPVVYRKFGLTPYKFWDR